MTVLLVEDNPGDARLVEHHLASPAVERFLGETTLAHVESLTAAEERLTTGQFDVVLLDLGLPESSGLETLRRVESLDSPVPVIVLTGLDDTDLAVEAIQSGAQDYLPKGDLDEDRLARSLRYAIERHEQERELERRTEQIEFFNSILRHDLLNGMTVIRSYAETLEGDLAGEDEVRAETIRTWSDDIIELAERVRTVLDTLLKEDEKEFGPIDLAPAVREATEQAESIADDREVSVLTEVSPGHRIRGDELFSDVLGNVLTNAVTHTEGDLTIRVSSTVEADRVHLRVADDGSGIDPDDRDRIFERGHQGATSSGSGFGLYFVESMVESYGGEVRVEESDPGGAAFVLELPDAGSTSTDGPDEETDDVRDSVT